MIEGRGGIVAALSDGSIQDAVGEARAARQAEFAAGAANLIGVTRFPNADRQPPATASEVIADPLGATGLELASASGGGRALQPVRWAEPFEQEETGDGR
jgi:methylmalonyl-CoA mutase N-terminal domain/subunit